MQQKDVELAKTFLMSMGYALDPVRINSDDILEMGGPDFGHYTIEKKDDGFHVERIEYRTTSLVGHTTTEIPVGVCKSLPRALTTVLTDLCTGMAQEFFEPYAEEEYGMPALEPAPAVVIMPVREDILPSGTHTMNEKLRQLIEDVIATGEADIYYDSSFDMCMTSTTTTAVEKHQAALAELKAYIS